MIADITAAPTPDPWRSRPEEAREFPLNVMVQTTSACNLKCVWCPYHSLSAGLPHGRIDPGLYQRIIDECAEHPVQRILPYLMNEPMTDRRLPGFIDYAKERCPDASVHFLTNGVLMDDRWADEIISSAVDWVGLSLHGVSARTVRLVVGLGRPWAPVRRSIARFIRRAIARRGPDFVTIKMIRTEGILGDAELSAGIAFWKAAGAAKVELIHTPVSRAGNVAGIDRTLHSGLAGCRTVWANIMAHVLFNGDVIPCCMDWKRENVLGNVSEQSLAEIWQGPAYARFLERVGGAAGCTPSFLCRRCEDAIPASPAETTRDEPPPVDRWAASVY